MAGRSNISRVAMKAMGLFGGVQVLGILCSIVRTKLVAMWIGPVGVGLFGLFNQALEMLNTATNLNMRQSSVRDISQAVDKGNDTLIARMIAVVRKWSIWLALAGAVATLAFAPLLSRFTFGDYTHIWGFVALSIAVLLMALTNGEYAIFQGLSRLRRLASVTLWGTLSGLVLSVPLFYFLREYSILPSIIAYAAGNAFFAYLFRNRNYAKVNVSRSETLSMGKEFVKLGIYITLGVFVTMLAGYVFNAWLNVHAGTQEVGFYQAGYTLIYKYAGFVLTALGMEYYPRLARVAQSKTRLRAFVSQEINIAMMVMAPFAALFILFRAPIVWLLYSPEFNVIATFVSWVMVGTVFRAFSWCIAFVILARGSGKIFLITESLSAVIELVLNVLFYSRWGLTGLGISFVVWYIGYSAIVMFVYLFIYRLKLIASCLYNVGWTLAVALTVTFAVECNLWIVAGAVTALSLVVSLVQAKKQFFG